MRVLALIMIIVTLLAGVFLGYCYYGAQMKIESVTASTTPAMDVLDTYNDMLGQIENGSFLGRVFYQPDDLLPDSYVFLTLTVRMANGGVIPMDWITIDITPGMMDVLQLPADRTPTLAAGTRSEFSATVITRADADVNRKITVSYYVLGRKLQATFDMAAR